MSLCFKFNERGERVARRPVHYAFKDEKREDKKKQKLFQIFSPELIISEQFF